MLGVPIPGLLFRGGRIGLYFNSCGCFVGVVGGYSRVAIGGDKYRRLIHPRRFPIYIEWYREDRCVFIFRVSSVEFVWDEPIIYVSAELFRGEGVLPPFVYMVDGVVEEVFLVVYSCDVEWRECGVLGCCGGAG